MIIRFKIWQIHHIYLGILAVWLGYEIGGGWGGTLLCLGLWAIIDDLYQHWMQVEDREYQSPMHRAFRWTLLKLFGDPYIGWREMFKRIINILIH